MSSTKKKKLKRLKEEQRERELKNSKDIISHYGQLIIERIKDVSVIDNNNNIIFTLDERY